MSERSKNIAVVEITNCLDCPHHADRIDDEQVVCLKKRRRRIMCAVPDWCPILKGRK